MRTPFLAGLAALLVAACRSAAPVPDGHAAAPPPFELTDVTAENESLLGLSLMVDGHVEPDVTGRELAWTARSGTRVLGTGTSVVQPDEDGDFSLELPLSYGTDAAAIASFQGGETFDLTLTATLSSGGESLVSEVTALVRSPRLPVVDIVSVQASRNVPGALALTYLLQIRNPNAYDVRVGTLVYEAGLGGKVVGAANLPLMTRVPGSTEGMFEIPAVANADNVGKELPAMLRQTELPWGFSGSLKVGGVTVPVDVQGSLKLSRE